MAIHVCKKSWIATAYGLAMTSSWRNTAYGLAMTKSRHREERSDVAIHVCVESWIATYCDRHHGFGLMQSFLKTAPLAAKARRARARLRPARYAR